MAKREEKTEPALGFLTVVTHEQHGLFGGYLVLNLAGRPLEFHCTAPVKPNRAQQILYGPTLEPYLYGEQIGQALVAKGTHQVLVLCTDRPPVLAVRGFVPLPTVLVDTGDIETTDESNGARCDSCSAATSLPSLWQGSPIARPHASGCKKWAKHSISAEPFGRIRAAIEEAQRASTRAVVTEVPPAALRAAA